jgi:predicted ribosomally synthesized peptide with SipW-like signal peptide
MAHPSTRRSSRRRKIGATVAAVAVIGVAGGYGTYAAFTDTTTLNGSATAGTVQLNDVGADTRSFTVANLLPGDAPSICFDVAAPASGNTQGLDVTLATARTTTGTPTAADDAFAGALTVGIESAPATGADYLTLDGAAGSTRTLLRTETCSNAVLDPNSTGTITAVGTAPVTGIAALGTAHGTVPLAPDAKRRYRITVTLPSTAPAAAQGGTATFSLTWTGTAQTT